MKKNILLFLITSIFGLTAHADLSANKFNLSENDVQQQFEEFRKLFLPSLQNVGIHDLKTQLDQESPEYAGGVQVENNVAEISFGRDYVLNSEQVSSDILSFTLCHELGHLLGETPKNLLPSWGVPSEEAESDYFAAAICLKKWFKTIAPHLSEKEMQQRTIRAGFDLFKMMRINLLKEGVITHETAFYAEPNPNKKDTGFYEKYPSFQCRFETVVAGASCQTDYLNYSGENNNQWSCRSGDGKRPSCWYK